MREGLLAILPGAVLGATVHLADGRARRYGRVGRADRGRAPFIEHGRAPFRAILAGAPELGDATAGGRAGRA